MHFWLVFVLVLMLKKWKIKKKKQISFAALSTPHCLDPRSYLTIDGFIFIHLLIPSFGSYRHLYGFLSSLASLFPIYHLLIRLFLPTVLTMLISLFGGFTPRYFSPIILGLRDDRLPVCRVFLNFRLFSQAATAFQKRKDYETWSLYQFWKASSTAFWFCPCPVIKLLNSYWNRITSNKMKVMDIKRKLYDGIVWAKKI